MSNTRPACESCGCMAVTTYRQKIFQWRTLTEQEAVRRGYTLHACDAQPCKTGISRSVWAFYRAWR